MLNCLYVVFQLPLGRTSGTVTVKMGNLLYFPNYLWEGLVELLL